MLGAKAKDEEVFSLVPVFYTMSDDDTERPLTKKQWHRCFNDMLIGVEAELDSTAPPSARVALHEFHRRLNKATTSQLRESFEKDLDAFIDSEEFLKAAGGRYVVKIMVPALDAAFKAKKKARALLAEMKKQQSEGGDMGDANL